MKCIDPWLLNTRRQCPLCQPDVFPIHHNTNEKSNGRTAAEKAPLIQPSNDHLDASPSTKYEIGNFECIYFIFDKSYNSRMSNN
jgi:hypothetical protein